MNRILYSTEKYEYLEKNLNISKGSIERKTFSDGEKYLRIIDNIKNKDVYILGGTISDQDLLEIYDLACAASKYGANSINLIIPFFGYSTMERALLKGEVVRAKTRARLLSSIPRSKAITNVFLFDLHVPGIIHYFEGDIHPIHMESNQIVKEALSRINSDNILLASPDEGRTKAVSILAKENNLDFATALKQREGEAISSILVSSNIKGKDLLIFDDIIRSGGTILEAAKSYKEAGAKDIYVLTSHGIFTSDKLFKNNIVKKVFSSNSHPNSLNHKEVEILDISKIIMEKINENL
tara:strand:- start:910 stop:1797 length:888 start_codon:yes stop_codon:yes gene_type:complete